MVPTKLLIETVKFIHRGLLWFVLICSLTAESCCRPPVFFFTQTIPLNLSCILFYTYLFWRTFISAFESRRHNTDTHLHRWWWC